MAHTPLVIGNWKANPLTLDKAKSLFVEIRKQARKVEDVEVVIAPPFPFLQPVNKLSPSGRIGLGAQDVFWEIGGAHTGEVSLSMLQSVGVRYVIIGHSERRAMGETDEDVQKKLALVLKHKLTAVVCVGEQSRDKNGEYLGFVEAQVKSLLKAVPKNQLKNLVIAYEPIWAIGTGKTATPQDAYEMKLFIQKVIADAVDRRAVAKVRVLYGGSVKKHNAQELMNEGEVDGFLVGGASLLPEDFNAIINSAKKD